ncbi:MAG TPA: CDP-alcohol phosphatidyltransferase family protein [Myxococcota bacterium]|nr:CDP-alcohol phosphatidyltransferase family protein [Myxococcota bacterium]
MSEPIGEAIVLTNGDAGRPVAGVPLLLRTILALQRAGVERLTLVGAAEAPRDPRIRLDVATAPALMPMADERLRLIVGAGTVIDEALVRELGRHARPGEVLEVERDGVQVRVAPGSLVGAPAARHLDARRGMLGRACAPAREQAEQLLRGLENPRDGYLDRLVYRRFSRPLTARLLPTRITPNAVTVVGILAGIAGGLLLGVPGAAATVAAILLLFVSSVLDCCDGELARLRFAESKLGHWLDVTGDTVVHVALLGGIALRLAATGEMPSVAAMVGLATGIAGAFAAISLSEHAEQRRRRIPGWENRVLDGVLSPLSTRDWYVFPVGLAAAGLLGWLVPAAAVGAHVFWMVTALLLWRALRKTRAVA